MIENSQIAEMQELCNKVIYETVLEIYSKSSYLIDESAAINLVVSALSTNLGIILAQLPDDLRIAYAEMSTKIINASMESGIKNISLKTYGHIGHA